MTGRPTPSEVHERWREATARAGRKYMEGLTPKERLDAARRTFVRGEIDHAAFAAIAEAAIRDGA